MLTVRLAEDKFVLFIFKSRYSLILLYCIAVLNPHGILPFLSQPKWLIIFLFPNITRVKDNLLMVIFKQPYTHGFLIFICLSKKFNDRVSDILWRQLWSKGKDKADKTAAIRDHNNQQQISKAFALSPTAYHSVNKASKWGHRIFYTWTCNRCVTKVFEMLIVIWTTWICKS